ncbi:MAG: hypothetical protein K2M97_05940 [Muribaculaceae bacterium]|nr:hypothetical protein [Muribaculaceae bacterium]
MNLKITLTAMGLTLGVASTVAKQPTVAESIVRATEAISAYDPSAAESAVAAARTALKKQRKPDQALMSRIEELDQQASRLASLMQRVEKIAVIDSIAVDRDEFFESYMLSRGAGGLYSPVSLPEGFSAVDSTVVYMPENGRYMLWGSENGLMESERFTDGTWDEPHSLGEQLNRGGVANYPFMMADGVTLYYATKGDDSLGGYDLYISRRDDDGDFLTPQNLGLPYNSEYDDYMLAIDEVTGAGWWATDRNQIPGKVTIYIFIPSELRVNCDVDDPQLAARASLKDWRMTSEGIDTTAVKQRINAAMEAMADNSPDFILPLPDGRVYTHWADFRSSEARRLMEQYVDALEEDAADRRMLEDLRGKYRPGNERMADSILSLERKTEASALTLKSMVNSVIRAELPRAK